MEICESGNCVNRHNSVLSNKADGTNHHIIQCTRPHEYITSKPWPTLNKKISNNKNNNTKTSMKITKLKATKHKTQTQTKT